MAISKETIKGWLDRAKESQTHMLVVCDTFSYDYYPVFVEKSDNVDSVYTQYSNKEMQTVMEVYNLNQSIEEQMQERRSFNF